VGVICQRDEVGRSEMTPNYWMIVEKYPNQTEWLAVRFPAAKSSLYLSGKISQEFPKNEEEMRLAPLGMPK